MSNKLVLIDGNSVIYRAFYALPLLHNNKGIYTNAVYGFTTILMNILKEENPTHMLVAFDAGKTTFRHKTFEDYKGGRQKTPPELSEQFPILKELLEAFHIQHYELDMYEADDIIGTLAKEAENKDWTVKVISGDQDLLQLVSPKVTVGVTKKGFSEVELYTPAYLKEKMEVTSEQIIDLKALMGDSSDNIPGVKGVGLKTATKLLKQYETLENIYAHLEEITGEKLKENLKTYKEQAFTSRELATINRSSPVEVKIDDLQYTGYDEDKVISVFKDLEFQSLLDKMDAVTEEEVELKEIDFQLVSEIKEEIFGEKNAFHVEMLSENYHSAPIEGFCIVNDNGKYFIPTKLALTSDLFKKWANDPKQKKYVYDAKSTVVSLLKHHIHVKGITFDLLLASYLLNPSDNNQDIPSISKRMGYSDIRTNEDVYGKGAKMKLPEAEIFQEHVIRKTDAIFHVKEDMEKMLIDNDQFNLYHHLEMPLALILGEMEHFGVQVDVNRLKNMGEELNKKLEIIEEKIYELAGETFNLNSPKQLGPILFEKLQLPVIKKTKTGYSTAADVLEKLEGKHEIISQILLYRQLKKLQSTYIEGLLKVVDQNKIHTRFNQALTQTGRLSSIEPNLQNIPIRLEEGRKIRQAFVPSEDNWIIFAADYSQIELRVLAHIANDEKLIEAFKLNMDIHTKTAMDVFHVTEEEVDANMRRQAKAVNFGIVYGISDYGLSQNLGITRKEAKQFIERYFNSYPGVKTYMDEIVQEAKHQGYVTTIMNRRRYLPEITSRNFNLRSFAERTAMNTPIQGSAADIIKQAMIDLHAKLKSEKLRARMLLQVHDELILEAPEEEVETLMKIVPKVMEETVSLSVPLKVDYSYGSSWYDAK